MIEKELQGGKFKGGKRALFRVSFLRAYSAEKRLAYDKKRMKFFLFWNATGADAGRLGREKCDSTVTFSPSAPAKVLCFSPLIIP